MTVTWPETWSRGLLPSSMVWRCPMVVSKIPASPPTDLWYKVRSSVAAGSRRRFGPLLSLLNHILCSYCINTDGHRAILYRWGCGTHASRRRNRCLTRHIQTLPLLLLRAAHMRVRVSNFEYFTYNWIVWAWRFWVSLVSFSFCLPSCSPTMPTPCTSSSTQPSAPARAAGAVSVQPTPATYH